MSILCVTECYTLVLMNAFYVTRILHSILMNITCFVSQECYTREHNILRVRRMVHTCVDEDMLCHMNATHVY